ncbi:MAG: UDP-glucuronate 5-epimerase [Proteobacteria bacterium]|nr:MAG: UDP-glucuronate 5-epimerase [Pseudomonadota bacterium]
MQNRGILITGVAGFIGFHLAERLLREGCRVVGLDNLNAYYDPGLKEARLARLRAHDGFTFAKVDIAERDQIEAVFAAERCPVVVHLAAQAGVRYSLDHPLAYTRDNLVGFSHVLEGCRHHGCEHLLFASSSSVYGGNTKLPFSTQDSVDHPISFYAATKRANELMAHSYCHLYRFAVTGLRFFTVYGPLGRPDMALFLFADAIVKGRPIRLFNRGDMARDFTYIDDVVEAVTRLIDHPPQGVAPEAVGPPTGTAPFRIHNIGNSQPETILRIVTLLEKELGRKATTELAPPPRGDVLATFADIDDLAAAIDFRPTTSIESGVAKFAAWYRDYYGV